KGMEDVGQFSRRSRRACIDDETAGGRFLQPRLPGGANQYATRRKSRGPRHQTPMRVLMVSKPVRSEGYEVNGQATYGTGEPVEACREDGPPDDLGHVQRPKAWGVGAANQAAGRPGREEVGTAQTTPPVRPG